MKLTKERLVNLSVLAMLLLLFRTFVSYGYSKLSGEQFGGLTEAELNTPIKDLSLFKVGWYLFSHEPFNTFIGISQIIAALMLLHRKTVVIGALMLIPIVMNILIIDLTIMGSGAIAFFFRLSGYLFFIFCILMYHKETSVSLFRVATSSERKFVFQKPYWHYLLIPVLVVLLEFSSGFVAYTYKMVYAYFKMILLS